LYIYLYTIKNSNLGRVKIRCKYASLLTKMAQWAIFLHQKHD
jgi:hypothetical protein